ncbi:MAG: tonB-system energizer ExbB [Proteobacteria bacterium]|nr:tonB-system energizer ExbB [Pseudomonadota bacterium]
MEDKAIIGMLPADMTLASMFMSADIVVKGVMVGLVFASLVTWTIWLAKSAELFLAVRRLRRALDEIAASGTLAAADAVPRVGTAGPAAAMLRAASDEWRRSALALDDRDGLKERVVSHLDRIAGAAGRQMTRGTGLLATIGATAPFVGLFGTVWGIMNSFIGIAQTKTTNLAVVAPGIAEALLATACGLVAAIPAVVVYNQFARQVAAYKALVGDAAAAVLRLVSRDLSFGRKDVKPLRVVAE